MRSSGAESSRRSSVDLRGADIEETEKRLYEWKRKETRILVGKPVMPGSGLNLQQRQGIFLGIDDNRRLYPADPPGIPVSVKYPVDPKITYAESEDREVDVLKTKWNQRDQLEKKMRANIQKYGNDSTRRRSET